jgi:hypothetical protein
VTQAGGLVIAAAISRNAPLLDFTVHARVTDANLSNLDSREAGLSLP